MILLHEAIRTEHNLSLDFRVRPNKERNERDSKWDLHEKKILDEIIDIVEQNNFS